MSKRETSGPSVYALRINGDLVEICHDVAALYWKARDAVNGKPGWAEVEKISGSGYVNATFSDATLEDWERRS